MKGQDLKDLDDLYREIILDHYKFPRNKVDLSHIDDNTVHENPSCGDVIKLDVNIGDNGCISSVGFDGYGCAISTASASLMTEKLVGKTPQEVKKFIKLFLDVIRGKENPEHLEEWGDLVVLGGISRFPLRVKCATLAWHALDKSLENYN